MTWVHLHVHFAALTFVLSAALCADSWLDDPLLLEFRSDSLDQQSATRDHIFDADPSVSYQGLFPFGHYWLERSGGISKQVLGQEVQVGGVFLYASDDAGLGSGFGFSGDFEYGHGINSYTRGAIVSSGYYYLDSGQSFTSLSGMFAHGHIGVGVCYGNSVLEAGSVNYGFRMEAGATGGLVLPEIVSSVVYAADIYGGRVLHDLHCSVAVFPLPSPVIPTVGVRFFSLAGKANPSYFFGIMVPFG